MVFYPLWYVGPVFCSLVPIIVIYPSWEYRNIVPHIMNLILQLILSEVVHLTIYSRLLLSWWSLHIPSHLILLVYLPLNWSHGPILFFLVTFQISSCWTSEWIVKYILKGPLDLLDLVLFLFLIVLCPGLLSVISF